MASIPLGGWYRESHAYSGLRLQLLPFCGFAILLLLAACLMLFASLVLSLVLFALTGTLLFFLAQSYRANVARLKQSFKAQHCQGHLGDTGLRLTNATGESSLPWSQFAKLQVFPKMMLLHAVNGDVTILPREFFSPGDWAAAVRIARHALPHSGTIPRQLKLALLLFFIAVCVAAAFYFANR